MTSNLRDLIDAAMDEHPQHARQADIELDELTKQLAALRSENEGLRNDIRIMVEKAAYKHLAGYRELGDRAANAENERDALKSQLAQAREAYHDAIVKLRTVYIRYDEHDFDVPSYVSKALHDHQSKESFESHFKGWREASPTPAAETVPQDEAQQQKESK